jgi:HEAT repeat protein
MPRTLLIGIVSLAFATGAVPVCAQGTPRQKLEALLQRVKDQKPEVRIDAVANIAKFDPSLAVPALVGILATPDEEVRLHAALALGGLGKPAVGALENALADPHESVRFYAVWALGLTGPAAQHATPALIRALRDEDEEVRYKTAFALGRVALDSDEAIAALIDALKDTDRDVVEETVAALAKLGRRTIGPLRKALSRRETVSFAAEALSRLAKSEDNEAVKAAVLSMPDIARAFDGSRATDEQTLMTLLSAFGTKALPALPEAIKDKDWLVRYRLVQALGQIGVEAEQQGDVTSVKQVVEMLIARVADADFRVRTVASGNLGLISLNADLMEPALEKACLDESFTVNLAAYGALSVRHHPEARDRLTNRIAAAKGDDRLRLACLLPGPHEDLLLKNLDHADAALRLRVACGLAAGTDGQALPGKIGGQLVPILAEALKSPQLVRRRDAIQALMKVAPQTDAIVVPPLLAGLKDDDGTVRGMAAMALYVSPLRDAKQVIPALAPLLQDGDGSVRQNAVNALKQYGIGATPLLMNMLKAPNREDRVLACNTLKELGGQRTREAVPALLEMARDPTHRPLVIETLHWLDAHRSFGWLLELLCADKTVGPALRRAAKESSEPAKLVAVLLGEMRAGDPRIGQEAATALEQLQVILPPRQCGKVVLAPQVLDALEKLTRHDPKRLSAAPAEKRRAMVGQLGSLLALTYTLQNRVNTMGIEAPRVNDLYSRLAKASEQAGAALQHAQNDKDGEVRRLARRALRGIAFEEFP